MICSISVIGIVTCIAGLFFTVFIIEKERRMDDEMEMLALNKCVVLHRRRLRVRPLDGERMIDKCRTCKHFDSYVGFPLYPEEYSRGWCDLTKTPTACGFTCFYYAGGDGER